MTFKLPEPAFKLNWRGNQGRYTVSEANIGDTDCYTEAQLREAYEQGKAEAASTAVAAMIGKEMA